MKIEYLKFNTRQNNIKAFSTKRGVVNESDPYSDFNICDYTGDSPSHIAPCKSELCTLFGIKQHDLIMPRQTHNTNVLMIDSAFVNSEKKKQNELLYDTDAVVSPLANIIIGVNTADCVPILFYDTDSKIIAAAHAGWKGTVNKIASKTLSVISSAGGNIKTTQIIIGPSICCNCFEVGNEVTALFAETGFPMELISHINPTTHKSHIDLWEANKWLLIKEGILPENIIISEICTKCNSSEYFSARCSGINSGRIFTGISRTTDMA